MKRLKLERPICFFDLETTNADKMTARIVEACIIKVDLDGTRTTKKWLLNPQEPIPATSAAIHGFTDEMVADCPIFDDIAIELFQFIKGCDLGGFNSNNFDVPVLFYELCRVGLFLDYKNINLIDVCNIFKINEQRTLSAASVFYLGRELEGAHGAEADIEATIDVLEAQFERYPNIPSTAKELASYTSFGRELIDFGGKFARDRDGDYILTFGKNKGLKAKDDLSYLRWMIAGDFGPDAKAIASRIIAETEK